MEAGEAGEGREATAGEAALSPRCRRPSHGSGPKRGGLPRPELPSPPPSLPGSPAPTPRPGQVLPLELPLAARGAVHQDCGAEAGAVQDSDSEAEGHPPSTDSPAFEMPEQGEEQMCQQEEPAELRAFVDSGASTQELDQRPQSLDEEPPLQAKSRLDEERLPEESLLQDGGRLAELDKQVQVLCHACDAPTSRSSGSDETLEDDQIEVVTSNSSSLKGISRSSSFSMRVASGISKKSQRMFVTLSLPSNADVLRATHAGAPLYRAGYVFRHRGNEGYFARGKEVLTSTGAMDSYEMSFSAQGIQDFWSHSWHAPVAKKVATLLFVYNGLPAAVSGTVFAIAGASLSAASVLPPMVHEQSEDGTKTLGYAVWSQLFGMMSFLVVLLLWWSRRTVFLDKVCIHQTNPALKQQGVESIGGFLRRSDSMLVLWDETYAGRLWCIFEVAAFVKTHEDNLGKRLHIVPIDLGPVLLAFFVVACSISVFYMLCPKRFRLMLGVASIILGFSPCAWIVRRYSRKLNILWKDLEGFSVRSANCYCCSAGHRDPETQAKLNCDRRMVEFCIVQWFGDLSAFDRFVRSRLLEHFRTELGRQGVPYRWAVLAMTPLMWWQAETVCADLRAGIEDNTRLLAQALSTLAAWLCNGPLAVAIIMRLVGGLQFLWDHWAVDATVATAGAFLGGAITWCVARLELLAWESSLGLFLGVVGIEACLTLAAYCGRLSSDLLNCPHSRQPL